MSLIFWNYLKLKDIDFNKNGINVLLPLALLLLIYLQITIGAFVSGMDAGTIYNTWPLMGLEYFPDDNQFSNLFNINAFSDPSLVQFMHRNLAYLILVFYIFTIIKIYKYKIIHLYKIISIVGVLLLIQVVLGIYTLLYGAQIFFASMHQISSFFLVSSCIYLIYLNNKSNLQPSN